MNQFKLDPRLANDCIVLGELGSSLLLLMDNSLLPWFILVPNSTKTEIIDLTQQEQQILQQEINVLGSFVKINFLVSKLNIAAIGNIVSQLHIHIVGRHISDFCWPNVVWGTTEKKSYSEQEIKRIMDSLETQLIGKFKQT